MHVIRTAEGKIIIDETRRDCSCITHEGPHFIHMQNLWKQKNWALGYGTPGFFLEESRRLEELADTCSRLGVTHVPAGLD